MTMIGSKLRFQIEVCYSGEAWKVAGEAQFMSAAAGIYLQLRKQALEAKRGEAVRLVEIHEMYYEEPLVKPAGSLADNGRLRQ